MSEVQILKKVAADVSLLMTKVDSIEKTMNEIDYDLHRDINPAYLRKLEQFSKQKGNRYNSVADFDKHMRSKNKTSE